MYSSRNEYDRGVNTFSPEGRLFQVEYALAAVSLGSATIGLNTTGGIILCTEKRLNNKLMEETDDLKKISIISDHIVSASSGIVADARMLNEIARVEAVNHWFTYDEPIYVRSLVASLSQACLDYNNDDNKKRKIARPYGVSLLIGGVTDAEGAALYTVDPSGNYVKWKAVAVGAGHEGANAQLEEHYTEDISLEEGLVLILTILRQVIEEKMSADTLELCVVSKQDKKAYYYDRAQIEDLIVTLPELSEFEKVHHQM